MKFHKVLLAVIFSLSWLILRSQERCATVPYNEYLKHEHGARYDISNFEKWIKNKIREKKDQPRQLQVQEEEIYLIPVVVHVIHNGEAIGTGSNISDAQILSQIQVLNEDYRRMNADTVNTPEIFKPVAADTRIEFRLAERDPDGQETNGILRVQGSKPEWVATEPSDNQELKSMSFWPPEDYVNIWVTTLANNYLGYAQYPITELPGSVPPYDRETDGIVIHYRAFGSRAYGPFDLFNNYDRGRSTTHEVGHYFGLRHIWGDVTGCGYTDYCDDTPDAEDSHTSCTNIDPFTCGSEDMYQNYLDYSYDRCMNIFTGDQVIRMRTVIENSPRRKSLLTSPGLLPPQIENNFLIVREILSPANIECVGIFAPMFTVQNNGVNDVVSFTVTLELNATSFSVNFSGDTIRPAELRIVDLSPHINGTDLEEGQHFLKAGIESPNGVDTTDLSAYDVEKYFLVSKDEDIAPAIEKFEITDLDISLWSVYNPDDGITWEIGDAPYEPGGNRAAVMRMYDYFMIGAQDWLVSPIFDLSSHMDANVTFNFSYASGNGTEDVLDLRVSTDCGNSWPYTLFSASGDQLVTGTTDGRWEPAGAADWKKGYADLQQFAGTENVRLAFVTTNLNGNNLYLDNIEMFVTGFTQDITLKENSILLHPNPSETGTLYVTVKTDQRQEVTMQIIDMKGRIIYDRGLTNVLNQTFEIELPGENTGVYIIRATGPTYQQTARLILNR